MASTTLTRTVSSAGNTKTFTYSAWIKRGSVSSGQGIFGQGDQSSNNFNIRFEGGGNIRIEPSGFDIKTNAVYRDCSAWYHIVLAVDTTQATASDRVKLYVNGEQVTSLANTTYPSLDYVTVVNSSGSTGTVYLGDVFNGTGKFDGEMAHVNFIDGLAYAPTAFGETNAASGIWTPIASPSVAYGTNGFFLKFGSSGALGTDSSLNTNTFTVNCSGTQTQDAPSNVFATLNPLSSTTFPTFAYGNTQTVISTSDANGAIARGTLFASKGKYYWEVKMTANSSSVRNEIGVETADSMANNIAAAGLFGTGKARGYRGDGLTIRDGNTTASYGASYTNGDIIGVALDLDAGTLVFYKNGVSQGTAFSDLTNDTWGIALGQANNTFQVNTGNGYFGTTAVASGNADGAGYGIFEYAPPTGYYSLCTKNINTYG